VITTLGLMVAGLLFLASVPFGDSEVGAMLRRAAVGVAVLALLPAVLIATCSGMVGDTRSIGGMVGLIVALTFGAVVFGVVSLAAYGFLDLRSRLRNRQPTPHGERYFAKSRPSDADESREEE